MGVFNFWIENHINGSFPGSTINSLVYHGTKKKFNDFSYQKSKRFVLFSEFDVEAKGFFFSESPHDALGFGPNVVSCFINLKRPLLDPRKDKHLGIDNLSRDKEIDLQKIIAPAIERDKYGHFVDIGIGRNYLNGGTDWIYHAVGQGGLSWDVLDKPGVVERMKKLGYDGTFVSEPDSSLGRSIFVVDPSQIKIVGWVRGQQEDWGDKDDYYTKKKDGFDHFYSPNSSS